MTLSNTRWAMRQDFVHCGSTRLTRLATAPTIDGERFASADEFFALAMRTNVVVFVTTNAVDEPLGYVVASRRDGIIRVACLPRATDEMCLALHERAERFIRGE